MIHWSRIQDTSLALRAYILMTDNELEWCLYHNNTHIEQMYEFLEETGVP